MMVVLAMYTPPAFPWGSFFLGVFWSVIFGWQLRRMFRIEAAYWRSRRDQRRADVFIKAHLEALEAAAQARRRGDRMQHMILTVHAEKMLEEARWLRHKRMDALTPAERLGLASDEEIETELAKRRRARCADGRRAWWRM